MIKGGNIYVFLPKIAMAESMGQTKAKIGEFPVD